jgi:dTDP-4-amino-4,6-dideoxygalactose transaminase
MTRASIPFAAPLVEDEEIREVVSTLRSDWLTTGPRTRQFEREFAQEVNADAAVAVSSGTAALHLALLASGVQPGDRVITTPMTFCSTVRVIEQCGATPVLVDVDPDTLNLDPARVATLVDADRTRSRSDGRITAILPVHYAGHAADLDPLLDLARDRDLAVVEDAAHAFPASYRGRTIGSTDPSCRHAVAFSFYATKNLTTGEGGMLTAGPDVVDDARIRSLHGMSRGAWRRYELPDGTGDASDQESSWYYEVIKPGYKYNMTDIAAALGLQQLRKTKAFAERRHAIAGAYTRAFAGLPGLTVPTVQQDVGHAWHLYVLRLDPHALAISRNVFVNEMAARGIGTSVHFIPIHIHPYFADRYGFAPDDFPIAHNHYRQCVSLPIYPRMSDGDVERVIDAVLAVTTQHRR